MRTMSMTIAASVAMLWFVVVPSIFALSLDDAKAQGLVGEKTTGYLGLISSSNAEARTLVEAVNQKRRQA